MNFLRVSCVGFAASLAALWLVWTPARAQNQTQTDQSPCIGCSADGKTSPRTADGHPDLSGFWTSGGGNHIIKRSDDGSVLFDFGGGPRPTPAAGITAAPRPVLSEPSYKPEYLAKVNDIIKNSYGGSTDSDPLYDCKPLGLPRAMASRDVEYNNFEIVQTPPLVAILFEGAPYSTFRVIYTDGRAHPRDLDSSYLGHTIGHWEGDTLVTDVVGLNDETWMGGGVSGQTYARIHSDQEHVVERLTRQGDTLTYEATVDDPVMFTKPWVITPKVLHHAASGNEIIELTCITEDKGHIIKPTQQDHFTCDYCIPDNAQKK
jgi:hypothetical protein